MTENLGNLIDKLKQQHEAGADAASMFITVQLISTALAPTGSKESKNGYKGVSVILPGSNNLPPAVAPVTQAEPAPPQELKAPVAATPEIPVVPPAQAPPKKEEKLVFELDPEVTEVAPPPQSTPGLLHELPTFAHWPEQVIPVIPVVKEVNQSLQEGKPSLHEKLEALPVKELGSTLQKEPIKDLKKAININERYQFTNHLFKGDETMYERSIKTINSFNVYSEAEFWIRRELAMKLSWKEDDEIVRHFHELVTRRFL